MSPLERAIYAAIAPTSTTLPALLPFCKTFEDHLWARAIGLIHDKFETELAKVESQSYWESEGCARSAFEPKAVPDEEMDMILEFSHNDASEDAEWGRIAKEQLNEVGRIAVSEGYVADCGPKLDADQLSALTLRTLSIKPRYISLCPQNRLWWKP